MTFTERLFKFLDLPSKAEFEQLQEQVSVAELLARDNSAIPKTLLSSQAKESTTVDDVPGLVRKRIPVKELQHLYLVNQFIFRGVNVRADELITRGYKIIGSDETGVKACEELITNSGGENLFSQISVNVDVAGDSYLEKVPNIKGNKLMKLKHLNPLNFGFKMDKETNKIIIGVDRTPEAYEQKIYNDNGEEIYIVVQKNRIAHLKFNTFADEFRGISSLQPVYNTTIRLMNMEQAAAEAAVKSANPIIVGTTETKSVHELSKWSSVLGNISGKEQVFLPNGVGLTMLSPGSQNFSAYSDYFMAACISCLGVPRSILTGSADASGGNRGTASIQSRHFYSVIRTNQRYMERMFNEDIFKDYAKRAGFVAPILVFNDIAEDADVNGQHAIELFGSNLITLEEARAMIGLETSEKVVKELKESEPKEKVNVKPAVTQEKKDEKETWNPAEPGSKSGTQTNKKRKQKLDPDVKSVR